jgi:RNA polymerase sigma factor (sigma-70 family)
MIPDWTGDSRKEALAAAYAQWHGPLVAFLAARCRDTALAEDLAHDAWLKAHQRWEAFDPDVPGRRGTSGHGRALRNWVYQIALRTWLDAWRRATVLRWASLERLVEADEWREPAAPDDVPAAAEARLAAAAVRPHLTAALAGLRPEARELLARSAAGEPRAEIAARLGLTVGEVKWRLLRTRRRLRSELAGLRD